MSHPDPSLLIKLMPGNSPLAHSSRRSLRRVPSIPATMSHPDPSLLVKLMPGPGPGFGPGFPPHHNRFMRLDRVVTTDDEAAAAADDDDSRSGRPERVFNEITKAVEDDAESTSGPPDLVLINQTGRISDRRNVTTAECRTGKGQAVAVSFWLVEPPDVSYFSVHCPGLEEDDFSDTPPFVLCAEGAFFLFCVTLNVPEWSSVHHFVYSARGIPGGRPSLHLLPDPKPRVEAFMSQQFGLLPCGDEHYAVAFLHHQWESSDQAWHYYAYIFSSETKAWKRSDEALLRLSKSDQLLFDRHASSKQITVGESSLGWVDLLRGILLLSNLFDQRPVITYIQLPAEKACITDEDGYPYHAPEYSRDITCCDDLIKFVEVEFDEPYCRTNGQGWRATTWNRKVSSNDWGRHHTVGIAEISVEPSYSLLLPELLNDETKQLEIKKLIFLIPTLSTNDDDLLYMMGKVNEEDDTAWVITVDMKRAALEALVPIATKPSYSVTTYCPCAFPEYYFDITPGPGMANPVGMHFERLSVAQFVMQVQRAREWFRELGLFLDCDLLTYKESRPLLIECCPVSSVSSNIRALLKYATCTDETSNAIKLLLRAFEDFDMLLTESFHEQATVEILRSKITVVLPVLDNILQIMLPTVIPEGRDQGVVGIFEQYEKPGYTKDYQSGGSTAEKVCHRKKRSRAKKRRHKQQQEIFKPNNFRGNVASNRWLRYLGGCMLMSISMLALCWMVLIAFEVWTEPAISNVILRSIGTKVGAIYKYYTDTGS